MLGNVVERNPGIVLFEKPIVVSPSGFPVAARRDVESKERNVIMHIV